jgi:hypothetical protein
MAACSFAWCEGLMCCIIDGSVRRREDFRGRNGDTYKRQDAPAN